MSGKGIAIIKELQSYLLEHFRATSHVLGCSLTKWEDENIKQHIHTDAVGHIQDIQGCCMGCHNGRKHLLSGMYVQYVRHLILSHIQQICCRRLWKHTRNKLKIPFKWKYNNWLELKKHGDKRRNCLFWANFFFFRHVFEKPSAAEVSESIFMRERVNTFPHILFLTPLHRTTWNLTAKWEIAHNE